MRRICLLMSLIMVLSLFGGVYAADEIVTGTKDVISVDEGVYVDSFDWLIYKNDTDTTTSTVNGAQIVKDSSAHTVTFTKYNNNFTGKADITSLFAGLGKLTQIDLSFHYNNTRDGSYAGIMILDTYGNVFHKTVKKDLGKKESDYSETITNAIKVSNIDKVYLYASPTKNGNITLSNLKLSVSYESGGTPEVDEGWKPVVVSNFADADAAPAFEAYDSSVQADILVKDTCPDGTGEYNVTGLEYVGYDADGNGYKGHENGGIKINITDKIKSGDRLSLSLRYRTEYYQFIPFIEVRSSKGEVKNTFAFDVAEKSETWVDYKSVEMPAVTFTTGDSVYFCIKCQNGFWHFSNLALTTSGEGTEVEKVDVGEKTIINESFEGGSSSLTWTLYENMDSAAVTITAYGPDGGPDKSYSTPCLQFKESSYASDERAGMKTEITSLVKNLDTLSLSFEHLSEWYNVHSFVEVVGADGSVKNTFAFTSAEKGGENCYWTSHTSAIKPQITFESGDKVYLCVKAAGGYWHIKNIVLTRSAFTGVKWGVVEAKQDGQPIKGVPAGDILVTVNAENYGYEPETVQVIICLYTGNTLNDVTIQPLELPMRGQNGDTYPINNEASDSLKVFIWDDEAISPLDLPLVW